MSTTPDDGAASDLNLAAMYAALSATNEALLYASNQDELYRKVCDAAVSEAKFLTAAVVVPQAGSPWMKVQAQSGRMFLDADEVHISLDESTAEGRGLVGEAYRSQKPAISNDYLNDERTRPWYEIAKRGGIASGAAVAFRRQGEVTGLLLFYSSQRNAFVGETVGLLGRMARNITFALENFEVETDRQRVLQALRESEERFRALTNLSSDWYWEQNTEFRFSRMDSRTDTADADAIRAKHRLIGKTLWETRFEVQDGVGWEGFKRMMARHEKFRDVILHCRLRDGRPYYISLSGEPVFDTHGVFTGYRGISKEITDQKVAEQKIQYLAQHDVLTGLPNRLMFSSLLNVAIPSAMQSQRPFAVLFIDLDRFKLINDTLGHEAGDLLLKELTERFTQTLRTSDVISRLGGDEFVVLVKDVSDREQAAIVATKLLHAAIRPFTLMGQECRVTASIGIALYPEHGNDEQTLMKNADSAMYYAKEEGKNNYQFYSKEINSHSLERLTIESNLRTALERNEFSLHYQAKLDLKTNHIVGVEALLRWNNAALGSVSPIKFIPVAEETGLIVQIGRWVLQEACRQNVAWQRQGLPPINVAVNISVRQFADDSLVRDIERVLSETGMNPRLLELEITEGMIIQNVDRAVGLLTAIKAMGVRLAIDDFGTGYSSLGQLKNFPIDTLKVDRSFIRDLATDSEDKAITSAIIAMGKTLSLTVIAEGVETQEQQTFLRDQACDQMQGYYFSKPVAAESFAELLKDHKTG